MTCRSSDLSSTSSRYSYTTCSSTPTSILKNPVTERKQLTPFTVYQAQPQSFQNPLFGTKGTPSPQLSAYKANADPSKISLESPASTATDRDHVPGHNNMPTPVANLRCDIDAAADDYGILQDMKGMLITCLSHDE